VSLTAAGRRLRKQPSWFRVPSFKEVQGHIAKASSQMSVSELLGGASAGAHDLGGTARYMLAQIRAAMRPDVMLHFLKLALPGGFM
jgi:hypothetical protein